MSKNKKTYTFEDWLEGNTVPTKLQVDERISYQEIAEHSDYLHTSSDDIPYSLFALGRMSKEDYEKVKSTKRKAYDILLNGSINEAVNKINDWDNESEKKRYLNKRKYSIEKRLEDASSDTVTDLEEDKKGLQTLSGKTCNRIIKRHENNEHQSGSSISKSFELQVLLAELQEIEKQLNGNIDSSSKEVLIKEFSKKFARRADYSQEVISRYLLYWEDHQGATYPRASAKRELEKEEIILPEHDNTLKNWEESWLGFFYSRTAK